MTKLKLLFEKFGLETLVFVISTLFIMIFAGSTTFLRDMAAYGDSAFFIYIGKSLLDGYVPYKDIFDIKGPLLWLIEALGQLICDGKLGIHILEILNFNLINFFTFYSARLFLGKFHSFVITMISTIFWAACFEYGNLTEELSSAFVMIAIYVTLYGIVKNKENFFCYYIMGVCLACSALIRVVNCMAIIPCIAYKIYNMLMTKQYKAIAFFALFGFLGCATITLPVFGYYIYHDAFFDMLDGMFLFSLSYSEFNNGGIRLLKISCFAFPIFASIMSLVVNRNKRETIYFKESILALMVGVFCLLIFLKIGTKYTHYMMLSIPSIVLGVIASISCISNLNRKQLIALVLVFIMANPFCFVRAAREVYCNLQRVIVNSSYDEALVFAQQIEKIMSGVEVDNVYIYGTNATIVCAINTHSRSKYMLYQAQWDDDPERKEDIYKEFIESDAYWIITDDKTLESGDERIVKVIDEKYEIVHEAEGYVLYRKGE